MGDFAVRPTPDTSAFPTTHAAARANALRTASISVACDASRSAARRPASSITRTTPFIAFIHPPPAACTKMEPVLDRVDRNRPKQMADALFSPSAIVVAGAGAATAIAVGLAWWALPIGAAAWAVRVAMKLPKKAKRPRIDAKALREPWRSMVLDAQRAEERYDDAVAATKPGPLRDRLTEVGTRIATGVNECWTIAEHGNQLDKAVKELGIDSARLDLAQVEGELKGGDRSPELEATAKSLKDQLASAERLQRVSADARERLRLLNAQLDESVARAVELSLDVADLSGLAPLGSDVENLVTELESLRQALDETSGAGGGTTGTATA